jgi:hypothetical protein
MKVMQVKVCMEPSGAARTLLAIANTKPSSPAGDFF